MKLSQFAVALSLVIAYPLMALTPNYVVLSHKEYAPKSMKLTISDLPSVATISAKKRLLKQEWKNFDVVYNLVAHGRVTTVNTPTVISTFVQHYIENDSDKPTTFQVVTYVCPNGVIASDLACASSIDSIELQPYSFAEFRKSMNVEATYTVAKNVLAYAYTAVINDQFNYNSGTDSRALIVVKDAG